MSNYFIERVQVEGGFLDGLDLSLESGLNTIIGARGTGKSTFIELIRYCLGISGHTAESHSKAISHARSVLKDGEITVTLSNGIETINCSRNSESEIVPQLNQNIHLPLIFSQTEVENIGLLASGRLKLIDSFITGLDSIKDKETSAIARIHSYSSEILSIKSNVGEQEDKLLVLPSLYQQLKILETEENKLSDVSILAAKKSDELKLLGNNYSVESLKIEYLKTFMVSDSEWQIRLKEILEQFPEMSVWRGEGANPISELIETRMKANELIMRGLSLLEDTQTSADRYLFKAMNERNKINNEGQGLRAEVNNLQKGAGEIARKCQNLRNDITQLEDLKLSTIEKNNKILALQLERDRILDELDIVRSKRSKYRSNLCKELSSSLAPRIHVNLEEASQLDEYIHVLINAFKGSGIQYKELAPIMAESIPPRELLNIIERGDIDDFISLISLSKDRAIKIINCLKFHVDSIATVLLEDEATFELIDGTVSKDFSELSTGQRCTVILPIILEHKDTVLIIDQPEDHIDNAFIVETLISAILRRVGNGQIIVTTHNANVPVLGNADKVILLSSDGTRGSVIAEGKLDRPEIIEAISRVMEGGRKAFKQRSNFYG
jgi:ABC-type cobalamin/Fe3+-siderophores transport system ATPase subunit